MFVFKKKLKAIWKKIYMNMKVHMIGTKVDIIKEIHGTTDRIHGRTLGGKKLSNNWLLERESFRERELKGP